MKRAIALLISATFFVGVLVLGVVPTVQAEPICSLATLHGTYGFSTTWFTQGIGAAAATVASRPAAQIGIFIADGAGGLAGSGESTQSNNGVIFSFHFPLIGTYTVNPNCTGSIAFPDGEAANFVIIAEGREVLAVETSNPFFPGMVGASVGIKMDDRTCSLASLNGAYGVKQRGFFQGTGTTAATVASLPSTHVGIFTADGTGGLSAEFTNSDNGTISFRTDTGTYTVNPDCTGSITSASGETFSFVIVDEGKEVFGIGTRPGRVTTFVAIRQ